MSIPEKRDTEDCKISIGSEEEILTFTIFDSLEKAEELSEKLFKIIQENINKRIDVIFALLNDVTVENGDEILEKIKQEYLERVEEVVFCIKTLEQNKLERMEQPAAQEIAEYIHSIATKEELLQVEYLFHFLQNDRYLREIFSQKKLPGIFKLLQEELILSPQTPESLSNFIDRYCFRYITIFKSYDQYKDDEDQLNVLTICLEKLKDYIMQHSEQLIFLSNQIDIYPSVH